MGRAHKLFDGFFLPKEYSSPPPKKKERKKEKEIGGIGGPSHFYLGEISPPSAEIGVFAFNKVKNGPKRSKSSVFRPKIPVFFWVIWGVPLSLLPFPLYNLQILLCGDYLCPCFTSYYNYRQYSRFNKNNTFKIVAVSLLSDRYCAPLGRK